MAARPPLHSDGLLSLALTVVGHSTTPLVLLDGDLKVIAASASFVSAFGLDAAGVPGTSLFALGGGEWNLPRLRSLLSATVSGQAEIEAYEMDLEGPALGKRCLVLNAHKLDYADSDGIRLLLAVADITETRASEKLKDDLLREKAIMLQEIQHRVANSLQIIASVILQSARKVQSEETRVHLTDAHSRVMSVAALQQQLAVSGLGDVELRPYFEQLCLSVGASMIRDHNQLSLEVDVDDSIVNADTSVSLGLIVTELVINSLKHAFPGHRRGKILVAYQSHGPNWTLSVHDNGVGMPTDAASKTPGLGTSIVEALAKQLSARVQVSEACPGTRVSIIHSQSAVVDADADAASAVGAI